MVKMLHFKLDTFVTMRSWKRKEWRNIYHTNISQNKAGVSTLVSGKVDFRIINIMKDGRVN